MKKPAHQLIAEVPLSSSRIGMTIGIDLGDVWSHYCTLNHESCRGHGPSRSVPPSLQRSWSVAQRRGPEFGHAENPRASQRNRPLSKWLRRLPVSEWLRFSSYLEILSPRWVTSAYWQCVMIVAMDLSGPMQSRLDKEVSCGEQ